MNKCTNPDPNKCCYFHVLNYGGFLVRFCGDYEVCGQSHTFASGVFTMGQEKMINIPSCACNINFVIQISILPCVWSNIYKETYNNSDQLCFLTYGLTFDPCCTPISSNTPELLKSIFPSGVFVPIDSCEQCYLNNCTDSCDNSCINNNCCTCDNPCINNPPNSCEPSYNNCDNNSYDYSCESYNNNQYNCSDPYQNNYYPSNPNDYNNYYNNTTY